LPPWDTELFILRADDRAHLRPQVQALLAYLDRTPDVRLKDLAFTLNTNLLSRGSRLAVVAGSLADLRSRLTRAAERLADARCHLIRDVAGIYYFEQPLYPDGRVAMLFPGEGSQYLNMLKDVYLHFSDVRAYLDECDQLASRAGRTDQPLARLLFVDESDADEKARAEQELRKLGNAMICVLIGDWAVYRLLERLGVPNDVMAGHSVGELSALGAAGCFDTDSLRMGRVVNTIETLERQEKDGKSPETVMLAVGAGRAAIAEVIEQKAGNAVFLAMDNCPHQTVVVGPPEPMAAVEAELQARRILCERLPFSWPYHTQLFEPYLGMIDTMFEATTFRVPRACVYSGSTARPFPPDPDVIRRQALGHWATPVQFTRMIEQMYADGIRIFVETGPRGNVSAFVEDILRGRPFAALPADVKRRSGITQLHHLAGQLAAHHVPLCLEYLYAHRQPQHVDWHPINPQSAIRNPQSPVLGALTQPRSRGIVLDQYMGVMEQFLDVQREVMEDFLAKRKGGGVQFANGVVKEMPVVATPPQRPLIGEILEHTPGREITMRRRLDLSEDLFGADHTIGGRTVSKVDPNQHGLPVMPMTFSLEMMAELASLLVPGNVVISLKRIRLLRWLPFDDQEPTTVEVTARVLPENGTAGYQQVAVEIRDLGNSTRPGNAKWVAVQGTVVLADTYPKAPAAGPFVLANDRPCRISLEVLYKNLFHGPLFQGVVSTDRIGDNGIESQVRVLPRSGWFRSAPNPDLILDPVLIDATMHPLASWHLEQPDQAGRILLPFELASLDLYGPMPSVGTVVQSRGQIEDFSARHFTHGVDVVSPEGRLWCRLTSAKYWRFYVPFGEVNFHGPKDEYFLSVPWKQLHIGQPGQDKKFSSLMRLDPPADTKQPVLRLATARVTLSPAELGSFRALKGTDGQINEWLFGRIAGKDAVRTLWWEHHGERLFPADIDVDLDSAGRFLARRRGSTGASPFPRVAFVYTDGLAAGLAAFTPELGLALERIKPADENALSRDEEAILSDCARKAAASALAQEPERLTVRAVDAASGKILVAADSDVLVVWTARDGDWIVAATFGEREAR
jgi:malonyl CoA-acyl carrier protein transacylase